jgi:branched-chain amino acid transport system substrate-binding protein
VSLEGYLVGRLAIAALEKTGAAPTRERFLKSIRDTGAFDFGGLTMTFGPTDNEGLDQVFMTMIEANGKFKAIEKMIRLTSN